MSELLNVLPMLEISMGPSGSTMTASVPVLHAAVLAIAASRTRKKDRRQTSTNSSD